MKNAPHSLIYMFLRSQNEATNAARALNSFLKGQIGVISRFDDHQDDEMRVIECRPAGEAERNEFRKYFGKWQRIVQLLLIVKIPGNATAAGCPGARLLWRAKAATPGLADNETRDDADLPGSL